jgi:hypothetical protein
MGIELKMRTERNMDNDSQVDNELKPLSAEHATSEKAELDTQVAGLQSKSAGADKVSESVEDLETSQPALETELPDVKVSSAEAVSKKTAEPDATITEFQTTLDDADKTSSNSLKDLEASDFIELKTPTEPSTPTELKSPPSLKSYTKPQLLALLTKRCPTVLSTLPPPSFFTTNLTALNNENPIPSLEIGHTMTKSRFKVPKTTLWLEQAPTPMNI